jgi:hypothetical protein
METDFTQKVKWYNRAINKATETGSESYKFLVGQKHNFILNYKS